ncbi:MAG: hypothetical protein ACI4D3_03590 [Lachnospiraceae bacterium]
MDFEEKMEAKKVSEDEKFVVYQYGHLMSRNKMTGKLKISNGELPSVSTVQLEEGYSTRVNEMRIGGKIILEYMMNGQWPETVKLV